MLYIFLSPSSHFWLGGGGGGAAPVVQLGFIFFIRGALGALDFPRGGGNKMLTF